MGVCDTSSRLCMLNHCDDYPGTLAIRKLIESKLNLTYNAGNSIPHRQ